MFVGNTHKHTPTHTNSHTPTHTHTLTHNHTHIHTHTRIYIYMCVCVCVGFGIKMSKRADMSSNPTERPRKQHWVYIPIADTCKYIFLCFFCPCLSSHQIVLTMLFSLQAIWHSPLLDTTRVSILLLLFRSSLHMCHLTSGYDEFRKSPHFSQIF